LLYSSLRNTRLFHPLPQRQDFSVVLEQPWFATGQILAPMMQAGVEEGAKIGVAFATKGVHKPASGNREDAAVLAVREN
jgi:hypothetical protein